MATQSREAPPSEWESQSLIGKVSAAAVRIPGCYRNSQPSETRAQDCTCTIIIIIIYSLYSAFLDTQSALHSKGGISSSTTSVQHPPGWCDGSHSAPERPPHTSLLVERRQSDEANQCMGMIRRPWWSEANGRIWPGCRDNTPTLFWRTFWEF